MYFAQLFELDSHLGTDLLEFVIYTLFELDIEKKIKCFEIQL